MMHTRRGAISWGLLAALTSTLACATKAPDTTTGSTPPPAGEPAPTDSSAAGATTPDPALEAALDGPQRSAEHKARDVYRHPAETLTFFGVTPSSTVVELWPGGGWYTEILAPYLHDHGRLIVTVADEFGPEKYYGTQQARDMAKRIEKQPEIYGKVERVLVPQEVKLKADESVESVKVLPFELAPEGTVDVVLTFRNSHGWFRRDVQGLIYGAAFKALKPGGVFGVVQHRAPEGGDPKKWAEKGYLPEETVIDAAKAVGFELAARSEINANPADTKDYPEGVWTLPPSYELGAKDHDKYAAIGESDRMTLKFVKPE